MVIIISFTKVFVFNKPFPQLKEKCKKRKYRIWFGSIKS